MKTLSPTRLTLDRNKVESSKQRILDAALKVAATPGGWSKLTREAVASEADCAEGLVSKYFGTMITFRRSIMRAAIAGRNLSLIAQGLAAGDKYARKADEELKRQALATLAG